MTKRAPAWRSFDHQAEVLGDGVIHLPVTARGERAFLHVASSNTAAIRLYERLGFTIRREVRFHGYRVP